MKILHTADWHLGKRLDRFSRFEEQIAVLDEIINLADQHEVDMVLVAGDLFDNFNPPVEAIDLFYRTLVRLSKNGRRPVVAIAGNHDSPAFIDSPNSLAKANGIILIGYPKSVVQQFKTDSFEIAQSLEGFLELKLNKYDYPIRILHTAYANEIRLKQYLSTENSLQEALAQHWASLAENYCNHQGVNLLITHLYMNQRSATLLEEPDGERPLKIGHADLIYTDAIPPQIQYTALGHLHRCIVLESSSHAPVVYASSPLSYSFSEAGQKKYVILLEAEPKKDVSFQKLSLKQGKDLVRKAFESVNDAVAWLRLHPSTLVELTLKTNQFLSAEDRQQIYQSHDGIIYLIPQIKTQEIETSENIELNLDEKILFQSYFQSKHQGQTPGEDIIDLLNEIINQ